MTGGGRQLALLTALVVLATPLSAIAEPPGAAGPAPASDRIIARLDDTLAWYRDATRAMRGFDGAASDLLRPQDAETALAILRRAFDVARARAALAAAADDSHEGGSEHPAGSPAAGGASLVAAIQRDQEEVRRLRDRLRTAPAGERAALERELAVRSNGLELEQARRDFLGRLQQVELSSSGSPDGLAGQIDALEESVPELKTAGAPAALPAPAAHPATGGTGSVVRQLLALQQDRRGLAELTAATGRFGRAVDDDLQATRAPLRPVTARLRALAADPGAGSGSLAEGQREFHALLDQARRMGTVLLPLREESVLVRRYVADLHEWSVAVDREARQLLQSLVLQMAGVAIAFAAIAAGAVLWRIAAVRYIADPARRRLVLLMRSVVTAIAIVLVVIFRFTSELAALVTVLSFAAAGLAFALQTVILAAVGYFSIIGPNGIRIRDRIGLQGPFGWVHGEVAEIGLLRIKLHELAGDAEDLRPTGRVVVFPNSAVFTGSFFKHPPPGAGPSPLKAV